MNMIFNRKLPIPKEIKEQFPVSPFVEKTKNEVVGQLEDILSGRSDKFALVIGPCSADNEDSVLDYIYRLRKVQEDVKDKILIIPEYTPTSREQPATATRECSTSLTPMKIPTCLRALSLYASFI